LKEKKRGWLGSGDLVWKIKSMGLEIYLHHKTVKGQPSKGKETAKLRWRNLLPGENEGRETRSQREGECWPSQGAIKRKAVLVGEKSIRGLRVEVRRDGCTAVG